MSKIKKETIAPKMNTVTEGGSPVEASQRRGHKHNRESEGLHSQLMGCHLSHCRRKSWRGERELFLAIIQLF